MTAQAAYISLGAEICRDLPQAERLEWLVTNGLGGFASGTVAGSLTRRYHGLLVAALKPPIGRTLLVSKLDETAEYAGARHPLYVNNWPGISGEAGGNRFIERFYLDGTTPVWLFTLGDSRLEKRIWMEPGRSRTYVRYRLLRASGRLNLSARVLVNRRGMHAQSEAGSWDLTSTSVSHGLALRGPGLSRPVYLLSDRARATPEHTWITRFRLIEEEERGLPALDDHLLAGTFEAGLEQGEALTFAFSLADGSAPEGSAALERRKAYDLRLLHAAGVEAAEDPVLGQLVLAADQFIVRRPAANAEEGGRTVIAGYHWFGDWGRDTMIALPGLALATGRPETAAEMLRTYSRYVDAGMIPNRFPEAGEGPEYNTVDAALWYIEAVRAYHAATGDLDLVERLWPALEQIVSRYHDGTRFQIHADPEDGLLYAGEAGQQLTSMDVKIGDWVVTPRTGKAVEVNALWYNALRSMAEFARLLARGSASYAALADQARSGFDRFWNEPVGGCWDVLDSPQGDDPSLRPNQILAVSLAHSPLPAARQKMVVDLCASSLLTPHGLRSLGPDEPGYAGVYRGDAVERDSVYHQGTVWGWLLGPFAEAHFRVYADRGAVRALLAGLVEQLGSYGLGSVGEIFDGDQPHTPRGAIAQAWSVAGLLAACSRLEIQLKRGGSRSR